MREMRTEPINDIRRLRGTPGTDPASGEAYVGDGSGNFVLISVLTSVPDLYSVLTEGNNAYGLAINLDGSSSIQANGFGNVAAPGNWNFPGEVAVDGAIGVDNLVAVTTVINFGSAVDFGTNTITLNGTSIANWPVTSGSLHAAQFADGSGGFTSGSIPLIMDLSSGALTAPDAIWHQSSDGVARFYFASGSSTYANIQTGFPAEGRFNFMENQASVVAYVQYDGTIFGNVLIGNTIVTNTNSCRFEDDGSGHLSNSLITWDTSGNLSVAGVLTITGDIDLGANVIATALPTSPAGLASGSLWNNLGIVNIV